MTVGTAVLLPALRNPVVLAQQLATIDQISAGRLIVGAGIAGDMPAIRAEFAAAGVPFEGRVGRLMEGFRLCKALWQGEPVTWDGRWQMQDAVLGPQPHRPGGPPIWIGTGAAPGIERCARHYDGWFPIGPDADTFRRRRQLFLDTAREAGRDPAQLTTALYLTLCVMDDGAAADTAIDTYLEQYYGVPAEIMRRVQACKGGDLDEVLAFVRSYVEAGAEHLVLRLVGDHAATLRALAEHRTDLHG
jgi:alkanesulfonate monooxygenase SsuD/methylene tetrahydromethanopterin reductase-like flavin-dependent oxidoreductase (luciferase family)